MQAAKIYEFQVYLAVAYCWSNGVKLDFFWVVLKLNFEPEKKMIPIETNGDKEQVKRLLFYQVENLKDDFEDLEEKYYHLNLDYKDRHRNLEFLIRDFRKLAEGMRCTNVYLENRRANLKVSSSVL